MINYPVAIFDFDGTLCASDAVIFSCIQKTFSHYNKRPPSETHVRTVMANGVGMVDALKLLNPELMASSEEKVQAWLTTYRKFSKDMKRPLYDRVVEVLKALHQENIIITVISNNTEANILKVLKENHVHNLVKRIIGIEEGGAIKPDPDVFHQRFMPHFDNHTMRDFIMIGDTATDIQFAHNVGLDCCWVKYGIGQHEDCQALAPKYAISHIEDILPIVLGTKSPLSR